MSAHKHTPEWNVSRLTPSRVDTPDGSISVSWSSNADGGERNRKAENAARLIAAAPELLEACMAMLEWDDREKDHAVDFYARMDLCRAAFDKARAAIAKATGEPA